MFNMKTFTHNGMPVAVIDRTEKLAGPQDFLDRMAEAVYQDSCEGMIVYQESLQEGFFDLKTGIAGEILQKFSNYRFKLAIVGDFTGYASKSLRDFLYESNQGRLICFKKDLAEALEAVTK